MNFGGVPGRALPFAPSSQKSLSAADVVALCHLLEVVPVHVAVGQEGSFDLIIRTCFV